MALELDSLEGIPDSQHGFFTEQDGKFVMDLTKLPDVDGLKTALTKERDAAKESTRAVKAIEAKFAGIDPDKFRDMMAKLDGDEEGKLIAEGKLDEVFTKRFEKRDAHWQSIVDAEKAVTEKANRTKDKFMDGMLDDRLRAAFNGIVAPSSMDAAILAAKHTQRFSLDDEGNAVQFNEGNIVLGKEGTPYSPKEWINADATKQESPYLYPGSYGGGDSQRSGPNGARTVTRAQYEAMPPASQSKTVTDGIKVVD